MRADEGCIRYIRCERLNEGRVHFFLHSGLGFAGYFRCYSVLLFVLVIYELRVYEVAIHEAEHVSAEAFRHYKSGVVIACEYAFTRFGLTVNEHPANVVVCLESFDYLVAHVHAKAGCLCAFISIRNGNRNAACRV